MAKVKEGISKVDFSHLSGLPEPVQRYFRHVLVDGQPYINEVIINQTGVLRTSTEKNKWFSFSAQHQVTPLSKSFEWNARVTLFPALWISIQDRYLDRVGSGHIKLWSIIPVANDGGHMEINSGELHRYLAEGVWYPTALLPESGVTWKAIDGGKALASITIDNITVALEFTFNERGEVVAVYTDGRYGRFGEGYQQKPWEGHFKDYHEVNGMKVPRYGEVGWWVDGQYELVWKGDIIKTEIVFKD
ncbi:DUF6920 family protein [Kangiella koreensis]|uniref:Uncharacterized protein n=1 Tax=Kangiella koreensis (strain DSM 16069 / JCM 12317 / KCTC 12182 / SW-125) TaxID=523791 RepID=C7R6L1_KANKD|nr:DUF6544 family protein [Kangiella koreensis]ACV25527.1 conserved hypothetical protein [Kangiella koreensis DSM 16069]